MHNSDVFPSVCNGSFAQCSSQFVFSRQVYSDRRLPLQLLFASALSLAVPYESQPLASVINGEQSSDVLSAIQCEKKG